MWVGNLKGQKFSDFYLGFVFFLIYSAKVTFQRVARSHNAVGFLSFKKVLDSSYVLDQVFCPEVSDPPGGQ